MITIGGIHLTALEGVLIVIVILLAIDKLSNRVDRRRLNELEKKVRDQAVSDRVYGTSHADLIELANARTLQRLGRNPGKGASDK